MPNVARRENIYIIFLQNTVQKDRLLIWNVKDGWEPLCGFLNKPIPKVPIPHDNKTGDAEFVKKYIYENEVFEESKIILKWNLAKLLMKISLISVAGVYLYKNAVNPLQISSFNKV